MGLERETWPLLGEGLGALGQVVGPALQEVIAELGLNEAPGWQHLLLATGIDPEGVTVERVHHRGAYTAKSRHAERLAGLAERGYLRESDAGYVATEEAHRVVDELLARQREKLVELAPLTEAELTRLVELLNKLDAGIEALDEPVRQSWRDQRDRPDGENLPLLERWLRLVSTVNAFRDDAHRAAWAPYDIDGHSWEIFTYIWNEEATSLDDLPDGLLDARGFPAEESEAAVQKLLDRRWIEAGDEAGKYRVSQQGKALRQGAEDATDNYFYAAWNALSASEIEEIKRLSEKLRDGLQAFVPEPAG
jgi:hypothetical protein